MAFRKVSGWWRDRGRVERWLLGGVAALVVLCVAVVGGRRLWRSHLIARELAWMRAAGEPGSAAELRRMYETGVGEPNNTAAWLDVVAAVRTTRLLGVLAVQGVAPFDNDAGERPRPGQAWKERAIVEAALERFPEPLRLLHEAAAAGGPACYDVTFEDGFMTTLEHVQDLRNAARLLALESHVRAHRGDAHGAAESIRAIFATALSLEHEPCLVSQYVRMACDEIAREQIQRSLSSVQFSDTDLSALQAGLHRARYEQGVHRALLGERAMGITAFDDPQTLGASGVRGLVWRYFGQEDQVRYLEVMRHVIEAGKLSWREAVATARAIDEERREESDPQQSGAAAWLGASFSVWGGSAGEVARGFVVPAEHTALNRAAAVAIGVERFRRRHGRLPERLEELVPDLLPAVPEDPFTGEPLRYLPGDEFYLVYSVGPDGVDNGGKGDTIFGKRKDKAATDLVFRVTLSAAE